MKKNIKRKGPSRPGYLHNVFLPVVPLRDLMICNFSVILGRLNAALKARGKDTYVKSIASWRDIKLSAVDIIHATWRDGDLPIGTRVEQLSYLTYGSPALKFTMHLVHKVTLKDSTASGHRKLLLGEALPISAWYTALVLEHAYINVAVVHAGLTQTERSTLGEKFNDPQSDIQVLILLADVSIVGLNLNLACSTVFIMTILRNLAQEIQLWGRIIRVGAPEQKYFCGTLTHADNLHRRSLCLSEAHSKLSRRLPCV